MSIRTTNGRRVQDTFDLLRIAGFRLHEHPQTL
jgi:hypothetical protein